MTLHSHKIYCRIFVTQYKWATNKQSVLLVSCAAKGPSPQLMCVLVSEESPIHSFLWVEIVTVKGFQEKNLKAGCIICAI